MIQSILNTLPKPSNFQHLNQSFSRSWCVKCFLLNQNVNPVQLFSRLWFTASCIRLKQSNLGNRKKTDGDGHTGSAEEIDTGQHYSTVGKTEPLESTQIIPIIPITHCIFPVYLLKKHIVVTDQWLMDVLRRWWLNGQRYAGAFLRKDESMSDVIYDLDEIHQVGTFVEISKLDDAGGDCLHVTMKGQRRIQLTCAADDEPENPDDFCNRFLHSNADDGGVGSEAGKNEIKPILLANVVNLVDDQYKQTPTLQTLSKDINQSIQDIIGMKFNEYGAINIFLLSEVGRQYADNPTRLADFGASLTKCSEPSLLQAVLEELDIDKRFNLTLALLQNEIAILTLQKRIAKEVEDKVNETDQERNLKELLKKIKKELGSDNQDSVIEKFRSRLESLVVPEKVNEVIKEEISKLSYLDRHSSEYSVTRTYVDWLTSIPWGLHSNEVFEIGQAKEILDEDHYGMDDVKERVLEFIAVRQLSGNIRGKILCFTGAPGVGKTSIGKSIARTLNREYFRFTVGGMTDVAEIKGHRRTYVGATPGRVVQCFKKTKTENPLILIDEIDKIGQRGYQGDPASALLEVLDPEQNSYFLDHYLDVPLDLSKVLFICTANTTETIPGPLRDRMEVIQVSGYVEDEKICIAEKYLIPVAMKASGVTNEMTNITPEAIKILIQLYCRESGVRNLQKHIEKVFRKSALKYVKENSEIVVTPGNLMEFVGNPVFNSELMYEETPPGVCTGLAWTSLGGSTLFIETMLNIQCDKKEGSLEMTGQLGDVMQESIRIAYTFVKGFFLKLYPAHKFFNTSSIHLHVPEGATPKDGPSAGCTIISALLSLAMNKPIKTNLAMTGEVSLTGKVLPVGGIKEKLLAARRSNIRTVLLPEGNRVDYNDLPDFLKNVFNIVFISHYDDVFREVFDT